MPEYILEEFQYNFLDTLKKRLYATSDQPLKTDEGRDLAIVLDALLDRLEVNDREELILRIADLEEVLRYQKEYIQYLIGGYTKEEFKLIAAKYAIPLNLEVNDGR